jgi:enhancing lycopene biosynthesis protein 2
MSKKVAIILSGCGGLDGSEAQEVICSILAIEEAGFSWRAFALNEDQKKTISHSSLRELKDKRNMMAEAGRLTHAKIENVDQLDSYEHDILWLPGGYGVVSSLSDIKEKGKNGSVHPKIEKVILDFFGQKKVIVSLCIAPTLLAKALQGESVKLTLGNSVEYARLLQESGHTAVKSSSEEYVYDKVHKVYSSPAYMNDGTSCYKIFTACRKIVACIKES